MRIFCYIALIALAGGWTLCAQTSTNLNTNAVNQILALVTTNAPPTPPPPSSETLIQSDGPADFDLAGHRVIYHDNVRVTAPNMKLRCEWLAADLPQNGGRVTNIVAETNVVVDATDDKGQKLHATGDKAVYVYAVQNSVTNETVTLTGKPARMEIAKFTQTGDKFVWNRTRNTLSVSVNPKTVYRENVATSGAGTNTPVAATNSAGVETNLPAAKTNLPPAATNSSTPPN